MKDHWNGHRVGHARPNGDAGPVEGLRRRETAAVEALVASYRGRLFRLAIHVTGNALDAEEVVQDALWTATRKIDGFMGRCALGTWLYRITKTAAYRRLCRRHAGREVSWENCAASLDDPARLGGGPAWPDAAEPTGRAELRIALAAVLHDLPDGHRAAFLLREVEGRSNPETARLLRASLPAVSHACVARACTCGSAWPRWAWASAGSRSRRARTPGVMYTVASPACRLFVATWRGGRPAFWCRFPPPDASSHSGTGNPSDRANGSLPRLVGASSLRAAPFAERDRAARRRRR